MAKAKKGTSGGLQKGVSFCESASQKSTETHNKGGNQRPKKGSDRI
ncbi:hypothetical protein [Neptuniibacter halophilus]|nr:hypothetical protein [Neptuniibacter halophilus]